MIYVEDKKIPSILGGAMIIAGGTIGAGMLANLPAAGVWFVGSIIIADLYMVLHDNIRADVIRS